LGSRSTLGGGHRVNRFFTLDEAQKLLGELERVVRDACDTKIKYDQCRAELEGVAQHINLAGGMRVDRDRLVEVRAGLDASGALLKKHLEYLEEKGCLVKDLSIGLIDFPTLFRGRKVLLCWKLGEPAIEYWHGLEEGFRGRRPIDQDFIDHHSSGT
jgi:hypothetical protein